MRASLIAIMSSSNRRMKQTETNALQCCGEPLVHRIHRIPMSLGLEDCKYREGQ